MSAYYYLVCEETKLAIRLGQGGRDPLARDGMATIYRSQIPARLSAFLNYHWTNQLKFVFDETFERMCDPGWLHLETDGWETADGDPVDSPPFEDPGVECG